MHNTMRSVSKTLLVGLGLVGLTLPAIAGGWQSFQAAFPIAACMDGWSACLSAGGAVGPGMLHDSAGRPLPSDGRVGWFDLQPTASFSPFVGLSAYSGAAGGEMQPTPVQASVADNPIVTEPVAAAAPMRDARTEVGVAQPSADMSVRVSPALPPPPVTQTPQAVVNTAPNRSPPASTTPVAPYTPPVQAVANTSTASKPMPTAATVAPVVAPPPVANVAVVQTAVPAATAVAAVAAVSCTDLVTLEPAAMMGSLTTGQSKCLEARLSSETLQTTRAKISLVMINNAEGKGDKSEWERLVKRHLEDIDRSDPDLCYKYGLQLSRGGAGRATGVIRWADYALENKSKWTGNTYKTRVFSLFRMKTEAANKLWKDAEATYTTDHTDENEAKSAKYRGMTKDFAREWLDYAKASTQDTKSAMQYCVSAAGTTAFCEG